MASLSDPAWRDAVQLACTQLSAHAHTAVSYAQPIAAALKRFLQTATERSESVLRELEPLVAQTQLLSEAEGSGDASLAACAHRHATRLERALSDCGVPTFYASTSDIPVDGLALLRLATRLAWEEDLVATPQSTARVEVLAIESDEGIVNTIYTVRVAAKPCFVIKVLPLLPRWRQRKCENEVCAMALAAEVKLASPR